MRKKIYWVLLFAAFLALQIYFISCRTNNLFEDVGTAPVIRVTDNPQFSYDSGTYFSAILVTITSDASADIKYTIDGSNPTTSGSVITGASPVSVIVGSNMTISAFAQKTSYRDSSVITKTYIINATGTSDPIFTPGGATYSGSVAVTISSLTAGSTIKYTTDGSDPTVSGTATSGPTPVNINIVVTRTVRAYAYKAGLTDSNTVSQTYTIVAPGTVATPSITPAGGIKNNDLTGANQVTITTTTAGATIYYTTDGTDPTIASSQYTAPFDLTGNTTPPNTVIKAIAVKTGMTNSAIASVTYNFICGIPGFSLVSGTYNSNQTITITSTNASIKYTTDGSNPLTDPNGTAVTVASPFNYSLTANVTPPNTQIRAIAVRLNYTNSAESSNTYTLTAAVPTFSLAAGTYNSNQTVTITSAGANIKYTTDGSDPFTNPNGTAVTAASPVNYSLTSNVTPPNTQIRAIAIRAGYNNSAEDSRTYTLTAATPNLSLAAGTYNNDQTITITSAGANIKYTTDGSDPITNPNGTAVTAASPVNYSLTANITPPGNTNTQIRAIAIRVGYNNSSEATRTYTLTCADTSSFTPNGGTYTASIDVNTSTITLGANVNIHYTKNGAVPTTGSPSIANPGTISMNNTNVIKTLVAKPGYNNSGVQNSAAFTILPAQAVTPVITPATDSYTNTVAVSITTTTPEANIVYTTDGSDPITNPNGTAITAAAPAAFNVTANFTPPGNTFTTVRAIARKGGITDSTESSRTYTLNAANPSFSLAAGTYPSNQTVTITSAGANIKYTTDGSDPFTNPNGTAVTAASPVNYSLTSNATPPNTQIRAIAIRAGYNNSAETSRTYTLTPSAPSFSLAAGTYNSNQTVTITSAGADIKYTTDGSDPLTNPNGTAVTAASPVNYSLTSNATPPNTQIRAIAIRAGYNNSGESTRTYTLTPSAPSFSLAAGTYNSNQTVTITSAGADIKYTTDGSDPLTNPNGTAVTAASPVNYSLTSNATPPNTQIRAIAIRAGYNSSAEASRTYTLTPVVPSFSLANGTYNNDQTVSITSAGADIKYTTDGSDPLTNPNGTAVTAASPVNYSLTSNATPPNTQIRAIAIRAGYNNSVETSRTYTLTTADPAPVISPATGTYNSNQTVSVGTSSTTGSQIYYRTDGNDPTTADTLYAGPFTVTGNAHVKMRAFKANYNPSNVLNSNITLKVNDPTFNIAGGTFNSAQTVTLSITTPGAEIRYTTDGSNPTGASTLYTGPIAVSVNTTIKAIGIKAGWTNSNIVSETYNIRVATVAFAPGTGTYSPSVSVFLSCSTSGATIYYTTDGSAPNSGSTVYGGAIVVSASGSTTIKAIAVKAGMTDSLIMTNIYTIP